jgi:hypothetical protein
VVMDDLPGLGVGAGPATPLGTVAGPSSD